MCESFLPHKFPTIQYVIIIQDTSGKGVTMHYPLSLVMYPDKDLTIWTCIDLFIKSSWESIIILLKLVRVNSYCELSKKCCLISAHLE